MSLDSWKKEFYPVTAKKEVDAIRYPKQELKILVTKKSKLPVIPLPLKTQLPLLDSSIRKWSGTTKENLQAHGVTYGNRCLKVTVV